MEQPIDIYVISMINTIDMYELEVSIEEKLGVRALTIVLMNFG